MPILVLIQQHKINLLPYMHTYCLAKRGPTLHNSSGFARRMIHHRQNKETSRQPLPDGCTHGIGPWLQAYTQSGRTWRAYIQLASIRQAKGFALLLNISYTCIYILSCHAWPDTTDESFITSSHSRIQVDCIAMIYSSHSNGLRNS